MKDPRFKFDYKPLYSSWCKKYTPASTELEDAKQELIKGNINWLQKLRSEGKDVVIYPSTGIVFPVYVLCDRKNANYDCKGFEPI